MINASHACELLGARVHFSGDSLIRDLWSATALWLLRLEGFDPFFHSPGLYQHAACMSNQWKYLENFGILEQMQAMGFDFHWEKELSTCNSEYYRWTQELFLRLHRKGLAYQQQGYLN